MVALSTLERVGLQTHLALAPWEIDGQARLSQARDPLSLAKRGSGQEAAQRRSWGQGLPPVPGRRHVDNQTDSWLEAISDKKEDKEFGVQVVQTSLI